LGPVRQRRRPSRPERVRLAIKAAAILIALTWPAAALAWGHHLAGGWAQAGYDRRHDGGQPGWGPAPPGRPGPPGLDGERPYRPHYDRWQPGQVLPPSAPAVVITDYGRFHLRQPPRGYQWLQCDGDFVLAATATGLIFEVIPGGGD
jgi:Ni/Co efflux regulator RcnB